ncbi:glycosyltransferase [Novosphingobium sp. PP1Y]|uniref:glycosyltransferase n=1 Tax=Novosphingobium sp. PP1Y TaxID=702113 RepID=UPI00020EE674|nr:glycosyltransferase [Novosphingobium sp. PP1Y]CCA89872.1 glycosyl transferase [Novosphingobium sp. PP1Y]
MNILQLTNYPTAKPQHGGQLRASYFAKEMRKAGHSVKSLAVYVEGHYEPDSEDDIPFGERSPFWDPAIHFLSDYLTGLFAAGDKLALAAIKKVADFHKIDAIICEQPWLMAAAAKIANARPGTRLIYSSQNVEFRLKRGVLLKTDMPRYECDRLVAAIEQLELDASARADLVIACTEADANYYRANVPNVKVVVAGNGVEPFSCKLDRVESWRKFIGVPFPVFVSSAHFPNAAGFWDMMAPGLTFLRPEEKVLIVGGVSDLIMKMKGFDEYWMLNRDRMEVMGRMEKTELQAIVSAAHVILLPIVEGEGSNLKTAEALEAGCSIVATSKAFRGFEEAMDLPHVNIADDPVSFRRKVRQILDAPRYIGGTPEEIRSRFHWKHLLKDAVTQIGLLGR